MGIALAFTIYNSGNGNIYDITKHTKLTQGEYSVTVTVTNGCGKSVNANFPVLYK